MPSLPSIRHTTDSADTVDLDAFAADRPQLATSTRQRLSAKLPRLVQVGSDAQPSTTDYYVLDA